MRLAERLSERSLGGKVFFCNSGAEAIECAIKLARRHRPGGEFVVLEGGFHGRTMGALSATPQEAKQAPFAPLVPGFRAVPRDDRTARAVDERTAAVLIEPIQGEGGIHPIDPELLGRRAGGLRRARRAADLRRDPVRHGAHGHAVGLAAAGRAARRDDRGQGAGRRAADRRLRDRARSTPTCSSPATTARPSPAGRWWPRRPTPCSTWWTTRTSSPRCSEGRAARGRPARSRPGGPRRGLMLAFACEDGPTLARRLLLEQRLVVNATGRTPSACCRR